MNSHAINLQEAIIGNANPTIAFTNHHQALEKFLACYPIEERWRLVVDGVYYSTQPKVDQNLRATETQTDPNGWVDYNDREPGSLEAFLYAWKYCLFMLKIQTERQPLTIEFIKELHRKVLTNVANCRSDQHIRDNDSIGFSFMPSMLHTYSKKGIHDLLDVISNKFCGAQLTVDKEEFFKHSSYCHLLNNIDLKQIIVHDSIILSKLYKQVETDVLIELIWEMIEKTRVTYQAPYGRVENVVKETINYYNDNITHTNISDEKISLIANTIQAFERIHPFKDGNGRVFVNLLMNYLLLQEGLPPATLFEPNIFDIYDNIDQAIKKGITNTLAIYSGKNDLFGYQQSEQMIDILNPILFKANTKFNIQIWQDLETILKSKPSSDIVEKITKEIIDILSDYNFIFLYHFSEENKEVLTNLMNNKLVEKKLIQRIEELNKIDPIQLLKHKLIDPCIIQTYGHEIVYRSLNNDLFSGNYDTLLSEENMELIINYPGFNPNGVATIYSDKSLLDFAMEAYKYNIVRYLLLHPAININKNEKNDLFFLPIITQQIDIIKLLIAKNADAIPIKCSREYLLDIGRIYNVEAEMQKWIKAAGYRRYDQVSITLLELAKLIKNEEIVNLLEKKNVIQENNALNSNNSLKGKPTLFQNRDSNLQINLEKNTPEPIIIQL